MSRVTMNVVEDTLLFRVFVLLLTVSMWMFGEVFSPIGEWFYTIRMIFTASAAAIVIIATFRVITITRRPRAADDDPYFLKYR